MKLVNETAIEPSLTEGSDRLGTWSRRIALLLFLCNALIILSYTVFPSQDGPVHLYYVDIVRDLLTNSGQYGDYFTIKQLITPYAFHYYTLLALEGLFPPEMSEKILLCLYVAAFAFSFRYLIDSVSPGRSSPWVLAGVPFCMHSLVYMGFTNFCFAVVLTMFLCGYWIRRAGHLSAVSAITVLLSYISLMLIHPVPIAIFLSFAGLHTLVEIAVTAVKGSTTLPEIVQSKWRQIALVGALSVIGVVWVSSFQVNPGMNRLKPPFEAGWRQKLSDEAKLYAVTPFASSSYRTGPFLLICAAVVTLAAAALRRRERISPAAIACWCTSALCFVVYVVAPPHLNGSAFFDSRFPIIFVVFLFASAAAVMPAELPWRIAVPALAVPIALLTLFLQWKMTTTLAAELKTVLTLEPASPRTEGVILGGGTPSHTLAFDPYLWAGVHHFRRSKAILVNSPWQNLPIIMLKPAHPKPWDYLDPGPMVEYLMVALPAKLPVPRVGFIVRAGIPSPETSTVIDRLGFRPVGYETGNLEVYTPSHSAQHPGSASARRSH